MKAKYYLGRVPVPRLLFDYLCTDKPTGIVRDLLAWLCVALGQCFMSLARWHLETGLWLAGDSVRMRMMYHLKHDE
jgi:hypothetical protein